MRAITFRPHHFLCSLGYQGKGYDDAFTANMDQVVAEGLHQDGGDDTLITVVRQADVICGPCPHRRGNGCASQDKIDGLDARHAARLNLKDGEALTWGDAKRGLLRWSSQVTCPRFVRVASGLILGYVKMPWRG